MPALRYSLKDMIKMIDYPNHGYCDRMVADNLELFISAHGSAHNHQNWPGGYWDHIEEVMNMAVILYQSDPRPFPFTLSSALLVDFLHDVEKPWKYEIGLDGQLRHKEEFSTEEKSHAFRDKKIKEYNIILTPDEENALKYVHGEGDDYSNRQRVMGPLGAFCHICDVWVARIRFDCPMEADDPWPGARRFARNP